MSQSNVLPLADHQQDFTALRDQLNQVILGQNVLIERLLMALLCDGHLLVEGAPGLAKTKAIKTLSNHVEGDYHRIQFTPDLLPADITGTEIFRPQEGDFSFQSGPIFHNLILADEINRAPAKVQSALLEAMAERQITIGRTTYPLPGLFLVMATQNPIEQEGTYPLPEAQLDRFLMHINLNYPSSQTEASILRLSQQEAIEAPHQKETSPILLSQESIFAARQDLFKVHMSEELENYLVQLVLATRDPASYGQELSSWLRFGASPRGTIALDRCSRAHAWLRGRDFVSPEDIQAVACEVLRHRVLLTFEAEAEGITVDYFLDELIKRVAVP